MGKSIMVDDLIARPDRSTLISQIVTTIFFSYWLCPWFLPIQNISGKISVIRTDSGIFYCLCLYVASDIFSLYLYLTLKMLTDTDT